MKPELLARHDARVPRYTSYPTAPHFGPDVDTGRYRAWLAELAGTEVLSIYLHIPFCAKLCWYCGCTTKIVNAYAPVASFKELLLSEIDLVAGPLAARHRVDHIHWGGGTPTILRAEDFLAVTDRLRQHFGVDANTETAVEIDPRGMTPEMVATLREAGVTRASLGVQDFRRDVQEAVNRIQPFDLTRRVMTWLREAGINDINFDLMYGLPHQTPESVVETVDLALTLEPDRIALFGYAHVPWMKRHQRLIDERLLPHTIARWRMATAASARLEACGFTAVGLDHFARPESDLARAVEERRLHRNFQGYTTDAADALIGFGPSAISTLPQGYVQNTAQIPEYRKAIADGRLATERGVVIDDDDRLRRAVIEDLMCYLSVDLEAVCRRHGMPVDDLLPALDGLSELVADGVVSIDGTRLQITAEGRPLMRTVAAVFDRYLTTGEARHSRAV